jgi:hypothetical protein
MYRIRDYLILMFAICLFLPSVQAEDNLYRIDGLPNNLHYNSGESYLINIAVSDSTSVSYVIVTITNGTLSTTDEFTESNLELNLTDEGEGWFFHWQAPTESFDLGEGNAALIIDFKYQNGTTWSSFNSIIRSPEVLAESGPGVPQWALSLAWTGASVTVILTVLGALILRRDRLT